MGAFFAFISVTIAKKIPPKFFVKNRWYYLLTIIPSAGEALIVVIFLLTLLLGIPVSSRIKNDISSSKFGGLIVTNTSGLNAKVNDIFGKAIEDSLTYLTVAPGSKEVVSIVVGEQELTIDRESETEMFNLMNEARRKQEVGTLAWSEEIAEIAREYSMNLWEREYFGHYSPEGDNVADRLDDSGIKYKFAGENLAMAPTVMIAHTGLMNSEGHRQNILDPNFRTAGIGVIDNGLYGKIFVQVFTD
jgi:uncharacterized protein YkwD